jgi:uncharacterized membrane protein YeiH
MRRIGVKMAIIAGFYWFWIPICAAATCAGGGLLLGICTGREPRTFTGEIYEELADRACPGMTSSYSRDSGAGTLDLRERISMRFKVRWILGRCASKIMMSSPAAQSSRVSVFVAMQN